MLLKNDSEFLEIIIIKRMHPEASDYWDANWLEAEIIIEVQGFQARYLTALRTDDFQAFYKQINDLHNNIIDKASFTTMEEGLSLMCTIKTTGTFICVGRARHESGNTLDFTMSFDNHAAAKLTFQLEKILKDYPVEGLF